MLGTRTTFGRHLDPLDAADGGLQVRTAGVIPYGLHPTARMLSAPDLTLATHRASEPVRVSVAGVAPTLARALPTLADRMQIVAPLPGSSPSAPEDVTPRPIGGTLGDRVQITTPIRVADPTQPARPPPSSSSAPAPDRRADVLWLAGLVAVVVLLSR